jgi:hypothetical protein
MCVQDIDVQCVLQFTLIHAAGCALHRRTSRVIHRPKLYLDFFNLRRSWPSVVSKSEKMHNAFKMKNVTWGQGAADARAASDSLNLAACYRKLELPPRSLERGKETQVPLWSPHKRGGRPGPAQYTGLGPLFEPSATRRARSQL